MAAYTNDMERFPLIDFWRNVTVYLSTTVQTRDRFGMISSMRVLHHASLLPDCKESAFNTYEFDILDGIPSIKIGIFICCFIHTKQSVFQHRPAAELLDKTDRPL
jgi:hypothetical protein